MYSFSVLSDIVPNDLLQSDALDGSGREMNFKLEVEVTLSRAMAKNPRNTV